jgi:hypothetical protein
VPSQTADHVDLSNEPGIWIYDIETYPNHFLAVFKRLQEDKQGVVNIYNDNELDALRQFVSQDGLTLVGYNNFKFDDVIIKCILDGKTNNAAEIYKLAGQIINGDDSSDIDLYSLTYHSRKNWNYRTCPWRNANYRRSIDNYPDLFRVTIFPTLPSHEEPAADACTLVGNNRQTAWTRRGQGDRRRQPSHETATPDH